MKAILNFLGYFLILISIFFSGLVCASDDVKGTVPVYAVVTGSELELIPSLLDNPCLTGLTVYLGWRRLQPAKDEIDIKLIESLLRQAQLKNKKINLGLLAGRWTPDWVKGLGVPYLGWRHADSYVEDGRARDAAAPVPWGDVYQSEYRKFVTSIAPLIEESFAVNSVSIVGGSNTNGLEVNLIADDSELTKVEFSRLKYIANWKSIIDFYAKNFKKVKLTLAVHNQYGSSRDSSVSRELVQYGKKVLGSRFVPMALAFTEQAWFKKGNEYADLVLSQEGNSQYSLQALRAYSKKMEGAKFSSMLMKGEGLHPLWLEVWGRDVSAGLLSCKSSK